MSTTIDEKVVEMRFDNKQFEKGVSSTVSLLDKLKQSLQLKDAGKAFKDIDSAADKVDFSGLANAVETVKIKFSALQVMAITALTNITNSAINAGKNLVKSLSVDQITAGWNKYADKTSAVQTIMAATAKDFSDTGEQMEYVNGQLNKLNWFTDETSYSFLDMVNNIGKFTSNGVKLDDAVTSMEGISTWAAISGANVQEAGRAMYNLSQAMAVGSVKLMDWKSIENANMATAEFKETVIETAVAEGKLRKASDGVYKTLKGNEVSVQNFNQSLADEWFTSDVLTKTLNKYGAFSDKLNELSTLTGKTATELLQDLTAYEDGTLKLADYAKETEVPVKELTEYFKEMTSETMALGRKAFQAAQEAKTFKEAIDATKDAVSTGWMNTFELIFGDYQEAKKLWTKVANELYDVFAAGGEARNEILGAWKELGGRTALLEGVQNTWEAFKNILQMVKDAFHEVFIGTADEESIIKTLSDKLVEATNRFKAFTEKFKMSEETAQKLKTTFKGLFAAVDIVKQIFSKLFQTVKPLLGIVPGVGNGVLDLTSNFGELLIKIDDYLKTNPKLQGALDAISGGFRKAAEWIHNGIVKIGSFWEVIKTVFGTVKTYVVKISNTIGNAIKKLVSGLSEALRSNGVGQLLDIANGGVLVALGVAITKFFNNASKTTKNFGSLFKGISETIKSIFGSVKECLETFQKDLKAKTLLKIAGAIAILAGSIWLIASIDPVRLSASLAAITVAFAELLGTMAIFTKITSKIKKEDSAQVALLTVAMIGMATAVLILSIAMKKIGSMKTEDVTEGLVAVTALMAGLVIVCKALSNIEGEIVKGMAGMLAFAVAIAILARAVKTLGSLDIPSLAKGLIGVDALMTALAVFSKSIANLGGKKLLVGAAAMVAMAVALKIAASAMKGIADLSWEQIVKGFVGIGAVLGTLVGIVVILSELEKIAPEMLLGVASMVVMAIALKMAVQPFKELGNMQWDHIGKAVVSMLAIFGIMGAVAGLLGAFSPASILGAAAMVVMALALRMAVEPFKELGDTNWSNVGKAVVSLLGIFGIMAVMGTLAIAAIPGSVAMIAMAIALKVATEPFKELGSLQWSEIDKGLAAMIAVFGALGGFGTVLGTAAPLILAGSMAIRSIAISFKIASASLFDAIESFAFSIRLISDIDPKQLASSVGAISLGIGALGLALMAFSPLSVIGSSALLVTASAISVLVPALISLSGQNLEKIGDSFKTLGDGFKELGKSLKSFGAFSGVGASAMQKLADSIAKMSPAIVQLSSLNPMTVTTILDSLKSAFMGFGEALSSSPFWGAKSRAEGINKLSEGVSFLGESLPKIVKLKPAKIKSTLDSIGDAFVTFGNALKTAPFWGVESKGEGIKALSEGVNALTEHLPQIVDLDSSAIETNLEAIGKSLVSFGDVLTETGAWAVEDKASAIATLCDSISSIADGLSALVKGEIEADAISEYFAKLGEGFKTLNAALGKGAWWGAEDKATGISTLVGSLKDLAGGLKALSELENVDISEMLTSIGTGLQSIATATSYGPLFKSESKANGLSTVLVAIKSLAEGIVTLKDIPTSDISSITESISDAILTISESFKKFKLDEDATSNFASATTTIGELITKLRNLKALPVEDFSENLDKIFEILQNASNKLGGKDGVADTFDTVAEALGALSEGTAVFAENETDFDQLNSVLSTIKDLADTFEKLQSIDVATITKNLTDISSLITEIAEAQKEVGEDALSPFTMISDAISNFDEAGGQTFSEIVTNLQSFETVLKDLLSLESATISEKLTAFSTALTAFSEAVDQGTIDDISAVTTAFTSFDNQSVATFNDAVTAIGEFSTAIKGVQEIDSDAIANTLNEVSKSIAGFTVSSESTEAVLAGFTTLGTSAATNFNESAKSTLDAFLQTFKTAGETIVKVLSEAITGKKTTLTGAFRTILTAAKQAIENFRTQFETAGKYITEGLIEGIQLKEEAAYNAGYKIGEKVKEGTTKSTNEASPSKVFYQYGVYVVEGFVNGINAGLKTSKDAGEDLGDNAIKGAAFALKRASSILEDDLELQPTIRPVIDLSNIQNGVRTMNGLFTGTERIRPLTSATLSSVNAASLHGRSATYSPSVTVNNDGVASEIRKLREDVDNMSAKMNDIGVYLDGRSLVGKITKDMDRSLGRLESSKRRGN